MKIFFTLFVTSLLLFLIPTDAYSQYMNQKWYAFTFEGVKYKRGDLHKVFKTSPQATLYYNEWGITCKKSKIQYLESLAASASSLGLIYLFIYCPKMNIVCQQRL